MWKRTNEMGLLMRGAAAGDRRTTSPESDLHELQSALCGWSWGLGKHLSIIEMLIIFMSFKHLFFHQSSV